jgi:hypothetical protein
MQLFKKWIISIKNCDDSDSCGDDSDSCGNELKDGLFLVF